MGTKIEHAFDQLATSTNSNNSFLGFQQCRVDHWNYFQSRKLKKLFQKTNTSNYSDSMDRMLEKHNIEESIKKTMQIHEEIFKHQVQELHRLYSVQKRLMGELKKESIQNKNKRNINHATTTTTTQTNSGYILNFQNVIIDDARDRSGSSCSGETTAMKMSRAGGGGCGGDIDLERPAYIAAAAVGAMDEAAGPSNKIMSIDNHGSCDGNNNEDNEVELTLSIGVSGGGGGGRTSKNKKNSEGFHQLGCIDDSSCPNIPMSSSSSATFDQENKMPHWLFGLSINRS